MSFNSEDAKGNEGLFKERFGRSSLEGELLVDNYDVLSNKWMCNTPRMQRVLEFRRIDLEGFIFLNKPMLGAIV